MKAVILAGGLGTRMGHETATRPKPLVDVGGHPLLWHILKIYQAHGIEDFVVCAGYAGEQIAAYFAEERGERWRVRVVDTGETTPTGGRLRRVRDLVGDGTFCLTYGDGVADVDITRLIAFHRGHGGLATVTTVSPRLPFGLVTFAGDGQHVSGFEEKPRLPGVWVNSGFFVLEPAALNYIERDDQAWEEQPLARLAAEGHLTGYQHEGYWQCMDAPRDRQLLEELWQGHKAPWKVW
jgi:glucose-1-phosphate cytidylyltransferase